jgi:hypothetical protein
MCNDNTRCVRDGRKGEAAQKYLPLPYSDVYRFQDTTSHTPPFLYLNLVRTTRVKRKQEQKEGDRHLIIRVLSSR